MRRLKCVILCTLALGFSITSAIAQSECSKTGGCNVQINEVLDFASGACLDESTHRYQLFSVDAYSGTRLIIDLTAATFTPALDLIDPTNHVYASNDNSGQKPTVRIDVATNAAGRWTVRVRNTVVGAGGPYTLNIQCQGGSAPPPITPPEPPTAFRINVAPTQITLVQGSHASVSVQAISIAPFASEIRISVSGVPSGVTVTPPLFTFASPGDGVQTVEIADASSAPGGSFPITFTGSALDGTARRGGLRLIIDAPCSPPFIIGNVASLNVIAGGTATLTIAPSGTPPFLYQWYRGFSGSTFALQATTRSGSFVTSPLTGDEQFWVRIANECGSRDSETMSVHLLPSPPRRRATAH